ncbi:hypothetical protein ILUMI_23985 [Ignelater luminosus]|uniref:Uncharacterized protein n=1 Tax=Ignelater luminosus TaxID=2038154 RepID=A0A8K0C9Y6_IGNLU|nr:hypothetical protein ILUMI_23985 [Ignelater luminosus]
MMKFYIDTITLLLPNNAYSNVTNEDSGDEKNVGIKNLPSKVEVSSKNKSDKFAKVKPLVLHENNKFMEHAYIKENHSVEECMVPYTGRHGHSSASNKSELHYDRMNYYVIPQEKQTKCALYCLHTLLCDRPPARAVKI